MNKPKLICYGGVGAATGANFYLETKSKKVLIDCGFLQGVPNSDETNNSHFEYNPADIDILFVTHAHADHIGKIPKLIKDGFKGEIFSTKETKEISGLMLLDMAKIAEENAIAAKIEPIYTIKEASESFINWKTINYHEVKDFGDYTIELFDAGHILGSGMYKFTFPSKRSMLFTGDLGNSPSPLLKDTEIVPGIDYLLMESVYGDRNHEDKKDRDEKFKFILKEAIDRKGTVMIPVFSLERTQVILYELDNFFENGELPQIPVYLDSPLASHVTRIYEKVTSLYNNEVQNEIKSGDKIFQFPKLIEIANTRESHEIEIIPGPKIVLAGSGMSTGGRIQMHEAIYLPDPNSTIVFVGYQSPGTLGREIIEGKSEVRIKDELVKVMATVEQIDGFSGHKDSDHLVDFVEKCGEKIKKVFVCMGEPKSSIFLAQRLRDELGVDAFMPEKGRTYELDL